MNKDTQEGVCVCDRVGVAITRLVSWLRSVVKQGEILPVPVHY